MNSLVGFSAWVRRAAVVTLVGVALVGAGNAATLASIRTRGDELARQVDAAAGDAAAEKALVEPLGELVLAFIDENDRLQRAGEDERRAAELRAAFEAVHGPLDGVYRRHADRLEKLSRAVMDEDGDLEALYETAEFETSQTVAAGALYYLNWLDYYGARWFDGARRAELLKSAEAGFAQFAVGDHATELVAESLLGRGLCYLELGNYDWARRDFTAVIESGASAPRVAKARLALLDAHYRGGDRTRTIAYARELLGAGLVPAEDAPLIRFYELQALLDAADRAGGAEAERYRREAAAVMEKLRAAGDGWGAKVDALLAASIDDPAAWAGEADTPAAQWRLAQLFLEKQDCAGAAPLLERLLGGDAATAAVRDEARYWRGACRLRALSYEPAAADFDAALTAAPQAAWAADARYLRFKALEAMMVAEDPADEMQRRYVAALRELLEQHPDDARRAEARYRLGEYLQTSGDFAAAIEQYDRVADDLSFVLRARFATLQSRFELLRAESDPQARDTMLAAIDADLARYDESAAAYAHGGGGDVAAADLAAKATLLRALRASLDGAGGDERTAQILADFAARHPGSREQIAQAARLRIAALQRLGRFAAAEAEVRAGEAALREEGKADALQALAASLARDGRMSESPAEAAAAARAALALYALAGETGGATPSLRERVSLAQLREKAGDLDGAAVAYREVLEARPNTLAALRGLARIAEAQGRPQEALAHWAAYSDKVRGGDTGWFRGQYEQARLQLAAGDSAATCERLAAMRTAMPALRDDGLRAALKELHRDAGC